MLSSLYSGDIKRYFNVNLKFETIQDVCTQGDQEDQPKADSCGQGVGDQPNVDVRIEKKKDFHFYYYLEILSAQYEFNI